MEPTTTALATTIFANAVATFKLAGAAATGDAVDAVDALLGLKSAFSKLLPDTQDIKSEREFAKQLHEMVLVQENRY